MLHLALGCPRDTTPPGLQKGGGGVGQTGIEGTVHRGPIRPVCRVNEPCDAPLSAGFEVRQGGQVVARFQSDSAGRFLVHVAPGTYTVAPDASAPLPMRGDVREVTVGPSGLTHIEFDFDTGIR